MTEWIQWLAAAVQLLCGLAGASHALVTKRDPRAALGWATACLFLPYVGPLAYVLFGINRVKRRARQLRQAIPGELRNLSLNRQPNSEPTPSCPRFSRIAETISDHPLLAGNRIEPLHDGDQAYPRMLADIEQADKQILLSTFIFDTDAAGQRIISALTDAAERGVDVRVLIDGIGELYSWPRVSRKLKRTAVRVARFLPLRILPPALHINLRNHRKIVAVDGHIAYTGGMNIGDRHVTDPHGHRAVTDLHFRMQGPVVQQIQQAFVADWQFATGENITPVEPATTQTLLETTCCRVITDGPDEDFDALALLIAAAISAAQQSVVIVTPYFLPSRELVAVMKAAAMRGVEVTIILPAKNNLPHVHWASRNMLWELLESDIAVYYQPAPFAHTKLMVIDDCYTHIGSANLDPRSLRLNFELVVEVLDQTFGETLGQYCENLINVSQEASLTKLDNRSFPERLRDSLAWLFSPYL